MMNKKKISRKEALKQLGGLTLGAPFATMLSANSVLATNELFPNSNINQTQGKSSVSPVSKKRITEAILPADLVNVFIDTKTPRWDYFCSATRPYGMVALSPDTHHGNLWDAGYRYDDQFILNFSHIHNFQTAGIPVMPVTGPCKANKGLEAGKSRFYHEKETAEPGYHKVFLEDYQITAELTATCRVGMHRYTFPEARQAHIVFDLGAALGPVNMSYAYAKRTGDSEIEGYSVMAPTFRRKKPCTVHFVARFNKPFDGFHGWKDSIYLESETDIIKGKGTGVYLTYNNLNDGDQIICKIAISYVSAENARMNLNSELSHWDFGQVVSDAKNAWNEYLGRIRVSGGTLEHRIKFYTDLWHTASRRIASDTDGSYADNTGPVATTRKVPPDKSGKPRWQFMDTDGLWGTHWNLNILWTLIYPEYGNWIAETLLEYYRNSGILARSSAGGNYTYVMTGDQAVPLLSALISNDRNTFDPETAYEASRKNAFPGGIRDRAGYDASPEPLGGGMDWYVKFGYIPVEISNRGKGFHRDGASMTLEYAFQDWCIAQMAKILGKKRDLKLFSGRSENWKKIFDTSIGWVRPKNIARQWLKPFSPVSDVESKATDTPGFTESNSAVYSYYVPHDIPGLIEAMGGKESFVRKLNSAFVKAEQYRFISPYYSGLGGKHSSGWVEYSNQPSCQMAHLFSYAGQPWKTQYWVRKVKDLTFGRTDPYGGYNGDEDQGQMGALGVLMAIGLFDVKGCSAESTNLEITSPVFDKTEIAFPSRDDPSRSDKFEIIVNREKISDLYVQGVKLNGKVWDKFQFPVNCFFAGGSLEIELGPYANTEWGNGDV